MADKDVEVGRSDSYVGLLAAIAVILAAALRFYGLHWGLPDSLHSYSYHPDEFLIIGAVLFVVQSSLPGFYNYPSLYIYLSALAIIAASAFGFPVTEGSLY